MTLATSCWPPDRSEQTRSNRVLVSCAFFPKVTVVESIAELVFSSAFWASQQTVRVNRRVRDRDPLTHTHTTCSGTRCTKGCFFVRFGLFVRGRFPLSLSPSPAPPGAAVLKRKAHSITNRFRPTLRYRCRAAPVSYHMAVAD